MNDTVMTIIGVFAGIIVVVLLLAAIAPKGYNIQRSIIINKPRQLVFDYVKYLRNMDNYSKWVMMDPNKRMTYTGTDGTEWYSAAWDSDMKQAGKGNQTIEAIVDGERIDIRVVFIKPFSGVADTYIATQEVTADITTVKWAFTSKIPFPMNAMLLFINMEKMLGNDMEESLNNLKRVLEK
ncbi:MULTISPECIES: SRPBCC family protein [unclassified Mucilaginibacter]|uniref:SRPBCC family protein n=1 Tax=unclassified Mucilaginibacter TaxID=2617802 RepID=UPI002AC8D563|nr:MULTISPECIES: SRPBCC family protein [unclassified Mucilaginibacter]MEB0249371.1 SRPBCC family protein [Mucilaginibacter sp. 5B2]MEB0260883.1 SRPBCC family protein [Mucilaginibacter sp. 10I4]MEB0279882.1 SRPBCC family protein [Mucilaginibacter sp. 10B2]WPX24147.1 SRPBCC family protein [Mucilaginibacter sp. 5C4]